MRRSAVRAMIREEIAAHQAEQDEALMKALNGAFSPVFTTGDGAGRAEARFECLGDHHHIEVKADQGPRADVATGLGASILRAFGLRGG